MTEKFSGKVALVTGAGSGIGRGSSLAFARHGAKVVVADIGAEGGEETVRMIRAAGGDAIFVKTDVSKSADVEAMVSKALATYGRLDFAHNNAGIVGPIMKVADISEEGWDQLMGVNLRGVFLCMKYEIPHMVEQGGGVIVNTSSGAGLRAAKFMSPYTASKFGVIGLTKTAALEYARKNIRINAIAPGAVHSNITDPAIAANPSLEAMYVEGAPLGRMGVPEDIAAAVIWLCSDESSFVTGTVIPVDGGSSAR